MNPEWDVIKLNESFVGNIIMEKKKANKGEIKIKQLFKFKW